jgi:hypothetical protein
MGLKKRTVYGECVSKIARGAPVTNEQYQNCNSDAQKHCINNTKCRTVPPSILDAKVAGCYLLAARTRALATCTE